MTREPMPDKPKMIELNEPSAAERTEELEQHLISASNELYLYELLCLQNGRAVPEAIKRARSAVRAEIKRLQSARRTGA
jgi:hypothetical protein